MLTGTTYNPSGYPPNIFSMFDIVRLPIWKDHSEFLQALPCEALIVIDYTTFLTFTIQELVAMFPYVKYWQIGNEPDHVSDSSWTMTHKEYDDLIDLCRMNLSSKYLVGAGLVSGDPEWPKGLKNLKFLDAIAIHPYGQRPNSWIGEDWGLGNASELINMYRQYEKPIWITEFGGQIDLFNTQQERAGYHAEMLRTFHQLDIQVALQFAFTDDVPGFGAVETETLYALQTLHDILG